MVQWSLLKSGTLLLTLAFSVFLFFSTAVEPRYATYSFFAAADMLPYAHYIMAFASLSVLARFKNLLQFNRGRVLFFGLLAVALLLAYYEPEVNMILFGFHFAFNDVYSRMSFDRDRAFYADRDFKKRLFRASHVIFLVTAYFTATYHTFEFVGRLRFVADLVSLPALQILFGLSGLTYLFLLVKNTKEFFPQYKRTTALFSYLVPDLIVVGIAFVTMAFKLHWAIFVIYHVVFWMIFPLLRVKEKVPMSTVFKKDLLPTFAIIGLVLIVYPGFMEDAPSTMAFLSSLDYVPTSEVAFLGFNHEVMTPQGVTTYKQTMALGIFHALFSLVLSNLNPSFIRKFTQMDFRDPLA